MRGPLPAEMPRRCIREILSYVYDPQRDLSEVVILDAQDFAGEPVPTIRLPVRVPFQ